MSINSIWNRVEIWKWLLTCKIQVKFNVEISEICQFRVKILNYEKNYVIIGLWSLNKLNALDWLEILKLAFFVLGYEESNNVFTSFDISYSGLVLSFSGYEESNNVFTSFDISCNDRVICAGCAQDKKSEDVHMLFW
jgi:hypothetical protein